MELHAGCASDASRSVKGRRERPFASVRTATPCGHRVATFPVEPGDASVIPTRPARRNAMPGSKLSITLAAAALLVFVLLVPGAQATPGALDPGFGTGGEVTTAIGGASDVAHALVVQPDGKLVAAGARAGRSYYDFAGARHHPDRSLDTTFNGSGKVTTALGPGTDSAWALALQQDGKLVAAGYAINGSNGDFALARYNTDGSLDTTFNGTGKVTTSIGPDD